MAGERLLDTNAVIAQRSGLRSHTQDAHFEHVEALTPETW
jgi:predicted nucleic acid-binding protein